MDKNLQLSDNLQKETSNAVVEAKSMQVNDNVSNQKASNYLRIVKNFQKQIKEELRPAIEQAHNLHKGLVAQEKRFLKPLQDAEQMIKMKISNFLKEEERIRREEQAKAEEKARREEEKRKAELEAQAKKHEEAGRTEKAEERRQMAEEVHSPVPVVPDQVQKQEGIAKRVTWTYKIIDEKLVPREYLMVNTSKIGGVVRAMKGDTNIPGVKVVKEESVSVRA